MSHFQRLPGALEETPAQETQPQPAYTAYGDEYAGYEETGVIAATEEGEAGYYEYAEPSADPPRPSVGAKMTEFRDKIARALAGLDRGQLAQRHSDLGHRSRTPAADAGEATEAFDVLAEVPEATGEGSRFPTGPFGYNRAAVDAHVAALEDELTELRGEPEPPPEPPPISITEEIERLGEQTASILVVAHDKAHETTRLAQEQADRRVAEANRNAVAITEEAKRKLEALDMETDTVWQERARLLEDARNVGRRLIELIDEAERRFPEELTPADAGQTIDAAPPIDVAAPVETDPPIDAGQPVETDPPVDAGQPVELGAPSPE